MLSSIPTRREMLAWALAIVLAVTAVMLARPDRAGAGASGPTTEVVYIATGANFPDALGAAATAAVGLGPVLLVQLNSIPAPTLTELNRLQPPNIVIVGGTAVISNTVQAQLAGLSFSPTVTRIAGANRYDTAAQLSQATFPTTGMYSRAATAVSNSLPDADGSVQTLLSVDIEVPGPGILLINAGAEQGVTEAGEFKFSCAIQRFIGPLEGSGRTGKIVNGLGDQTFASCATETAFKVTSAGTHTIDFIGVADVGVLRFVGALLVTWVPFDGHGGVPTP